MVDYPMKPLHQTDKEILENFVSHVQLLAQSRFAKTLLSKKTITLQGSDSKNMDFIDFDEEDCRSFLLGVRMLVQNNEKISVGNIWRLVSRLEDKAWFAKINPPRWMYNDFLEQESMIADHEGHTVTNQIIFETFMYGSYAHMNEGHHRRFKQWSDSSQFVFLKFTFVMILKALYESAVDMADISAELLSRNAEYRPMVKPIFGVK